MWRRASLVDLEKVVKTGILNDIKHRDSMKCEGQHPEQTF